MMAFSSSSSTNLEFVITNYFKLEYESGGLKYDSAGLNDHGGSLTDHTGRLTKDEQHIRHRYPYP